MKKEIYVGWSDYSRSELFSIAYHISEDYFYSLDASLMIASKGGIDATHLHEWGPRTKDRYITAFKKVLKQMYPDSNTSSKDGADSGDVDVSKFQGYLGG